MPENFSSQTPVGAIVAPTGKLTPAELERARAHLAAIVASPGDAIFSKTLDGIVTSWNAAAKRLLGFSAKEMPGQSIIRIIPEEFQYEETDILSRAFCN